LRQPLRMLPHTTSTCRASIMKQPRLMPP
jgi:hypothetical protein